MPKYRASVPWTEPAWHGAAMTQLGDVWVIPRTAISRPDRGRHGQHSRRDRSSARVTWTSDSNALQDLVHGLVPDDVRNVSFFAANGASATVTVK
jgi:hypothetical protein